MLSKYDSSIDYYIGKSSIGRPLDVRMFFLLLLDQEGRFFLSRSPWLEKLCLKAYRTNSVNDDDFFVTFFLF